MRFIFFYLLFFTAFITKAQQPNVILIITDDQGYGEVAAHGNQQISTPEMDKLYNTGIRLNNFHVNSVCSPSRAAIMTGKYASNVGVWHTLGGRNIIYKDEKILPQFFKEAGYKTAMVGKWHLGDNAPYRPEDRGFDDVFRIGGGSLGQVADYWGNGLWDGHYLHNGTWVKTKGFCTDVQFDAALNFMNQSKNNPFFLTIATTAPHSPIGAGEKYLKPYLEMGLKENIAKFYGMVTNIDDNIGRLRKQLEQLNLTENTIVIFMSDNGSANDKKGDSFNGEMRGKKGSLYEGGHRVPCFLYWPKGGWTGGVHLNEITAHVDLLPTLLKACKIENTSGVEFNGIALNEYIINPTLKLDRFLITEAKVNKRETPFNSAVVLKDDWRLVGGTKLFDLKNDFSQSKNIIEQNSQIKTNLEDLYMNWYHNSKEGFNHKSAIKITKEKTILFCMDLYPGTMTKPQTKVIWNQKAVLKGDYYRGFWLLDIVESGTFEIRLRRWPETINYSIFKQGKKFNELHIKKAQLVVDGNVIKKEITSFVEEIVFEVNFKKGQQPFQAEFIGINDEAFSAYYVYIKKK